MHAPRGDPGNACRYWRICSGKREGGELSADSNRMPGKGDRDGRCAPDRELAGGLQAVADDARRAAEVHQVVCALQVAGRSPTLVCVTPKIYIYIYIYIYSM